MLNKLFKFSLVFAFTFSGLYAQQVNIYDCPNLTFSMSVGATDRTTNGDVTLLQGFLKRNLRLTDNEFIVTGSFGRVTERFVRVYQNNNSLPVTGYVGSEMRSRIANSCRSGTQNSSTSTAPTTNQTTTQTTVPTGNPVSFPTPTSGQYYGYGGGNSLTIVRSGELTDISGAGLTSCNATTSKITYNSTTKNFECSVESISVWVNASDYGAVGDGVTDDTAAIQRALNAVGTTGGVVKLSRQGKYRVLSTLSVPRSVALQGSLENPDNPNGNGFTLKYNEVGSLRLSSAATIILHGNSGIKNMLIFRDGMSFPEPDSSLFAGTAITFETTTAAVGVGAEGAFVKDTEILGFGTAIYIGGASRVLLENLKIDTNTGIIANNSYATSYFKDIQIWPFANVSYNGAAPVDPPATYGRTGPGIQLTGSSDDTRLDNVFVSFHTDNIDFASNGNLIIGSIWTENPMSTAIRFRNNTTNIQIANLKAWGLNYTTTNFVTPVLVENGTGHIEVGNMSTFISKNGMDCMRVNSGNITIANFTAESCSGNGIGINSASSNVKIASADIYTGISGSVGGERIHSFIGNLDPKKINIVLTDHTGTGAISQTFGGMVGINTLNPKSSLDVYDTINSSGPTAGVIIQDQTTVGSSTFWRSGGITRLFDNLVGDVLSYNTAGVIRFAQYGAGTLTTDGSGNITASSDERLKNLTGTFTRGLKDLLKISPITYKWNSKSGLETENTYAGFSAQNIETAIPEAVGKDSRGYLTLSDRPILATIVNAIKELSERIMDMKNQVITKSVKTDIICVTKTGGEICLNGDQVQTIFDKTK